ncbi:hypothetical protein [Collinsella intestinalis]|uniref:hypothetical protein n=1 Tax=Collinsella intestinalis TaxID=147207 RepID=UPI00195C7501|nr:hypothetical protein [Collinsella intestinalis]MBM6942625.1 hypothetical protein [Collinsella intestinalis]
MNEWELQEALEGSDEPLTGKAIAARLSRARRVERILRRDLDEIASDDDLTYAALLALKADPAERSGNMQNALRWYYRAVNGRDFPRLGDYRPKRQIAIDAMPADAAAPRSRPVSSSTNGLPDVAVPSEPIGRLWLDFCSAKNRITAALGRSSNVVGELAERIVAEYHGTAPFAVSHPSADVELTDGTLIQVKARMLTDVRTTSLSAFRSWNFDVLAVILFEPDGTISFGGEIPRDSARKHAREVPHINGWMISTTHDFLSDPAFTDLTEVYRKTLETL